MDTGGNGLSALMGAIDVHEREATAKMEAASRVRDALSRARAALAGILPEPAVTVTVSPPPLPPPAPPITPPPVAPVAPTPPTKPARRFKRRPRVVVKRRPKPAKAIGSTTPRAIIEALAPVVIPAPGAIAPDAPAPDALPAITASVMEVAKEHPGHPIDVVTRMVMDKRKQRGKRDERSIRLAIASLVRQNRLHRSPEGELSA